MVMLNVSGLERTVMEDMVNGFQKGVSRAASLEVRHGIFKASWSQRYMRHGIFKVSWS